MYLPFASLATISCKDTQMESRLRSRASKWLNYISPPDFISPQIARPRTLFSVPLAFDILCTSSRQWRFAYSTSERSIHPLISSFSLVLDKDPRVSLYTPHLMAIALVSLTLTAVVRAAPLHSYSLARASPLQLNASRDSSCTDCRTNWEVVYSCLSTLFTCIWISIHPNIPAQNINLRHPRLDSARLAVLSLIFPEVLVAVAAVQFLAARRLSLECKAIEGTLIVSMQ